MKTTYTDGTTPAILKMGREWKLSPYGPENPDKDCRWFGTKAEAVAEADKLRELYLTPDVLALFDALAADAANWSGSPLFGGNVGRDPAHKGHLANLKKAGLVTTQEDDDAGKRDMNGRRLPPTYWVYFTDAGKALAAERNGIDPTTLA
jgi:hypothetical protein